MDYNSIREKMESLLEEVNALRDTDADRFRHRLSAIQDLYRKLLFDRDSVDYRETLRERFPLLPWRVWENE